MIAALLLLQVATWPLQSRVHSQNNTTVRGSPAVSASAVGYHQCCDKGTLVGGPATDAFTATVFWQVQFDAGVSGWARQAFLVLDSAPVAPPPPAPPPAPLPTVTNTAVIVLPLVISVSEHNYAHVFGVVGRSDGTFAPTIAALKWSTDNATVAMVDSLGNITTFLPGQAAITATDPVSGLSALCKVVVSAGVPMSVGGLRVTNTPSRPHFRFPALLLYTQGYNVDFLAFESDSVVARGVLQVYKP